MQQWVPPSISLITSKIRCGILDTSVCMRISGMFRQVNKTHSHKLRSIFINVPCHSSPEVLDSVKILWIRLMIQKTNVIIMEKNIWSTNSVNCSFIMLKIPVFSTQLSPFNEERWPFKHVDVSSWAKTPLHNLQLLSLLHGVLLRVFGEISSACQYSWNHQDH